MLIAGLFLFSFSHCQICIQIVGAGTVCDTDNRFTDEAAKIICMEMGYQCAENWKLGFSVLSDFYLTYQPQFYLMHILTANSKTTISVRTFQFRNHKCQPARIDRQRGMHEHQLALQKLQIRPYRYLQQENIYQM